MNWLDIAIIIIIVLPTFFGFRRGFLRKILGIAGLILGFTLAVKFYSPVSDFAQGILKIDPSLSRVIVFLLIIAIVFSACVWVARFIANYSSGVNKIDRLAGAVFGFAEGLLISSILLVNLSYVDFPAQSIRETSVLYQRVYYIAPAVFDKVISFSPELKRIYEEYKSKLLMKKNVPDTDNRR